MHIAYICNALFGATIVIKLMIVAKNTCLYSPWIRLTSQLTYVYLYACACMNDISWLTAFRKIRHRLIQKNDCMSLIENAKMFTAEEVKKSNPLSIPLLIDLTSIYMFVVDVNSSKQYYTTASIIFCIFDTP